MVIFKAVVSIYDRVLDCTVLKGVVLTHKGQQNITNTSYYHQMQILTNRIILLCKLILIYSLPTLLNTVNLMLLNIIQFLHSMTTAVVPYS